MNDYHSLACFYVLSMKINNKEEYKTGTFSLKYAQKIKQIYNAISDNVTLNSFKKKRR